MGASWDPTRTAAPAARQAWPFHSTQMPRPRARVFGAIVITREGAGVRAAADAVAAVSPTGGAGGITPTVSTGCGSRAVAVAGGNDGVRLPEVPASSPARSFSYGCITP